MTLFKDGEIVSGGNFGGREEIRQPVEFIISSQDVLIQGEIRLGL